MDPWVYPAFAASWFPYPRNRDFTLNAVLQTSFDYLYISHCHEDHFDHKLLSQILCKEKIHVLCPNYESGDLERQLRSLGFQHITMLSNQDTLQLTSTLQVTMILDASFKEDSGILLDAFVGHRNDLDQCSKATEEITSTSYHHRFLNLNDCNALAGDLPENIDLLAAQYSGAQWYPDCYEMISTSEHDQYVQQVLDGLERNLTVKLRVTKAREFLPSAGVHCFLDNHLNGNNVRRFNECFSTSTIDSAVCTKSTKNQKDATTTTSTTSTSTTTPGSTTTTKRATTTIFPQWEKFQERMNFQTLFPNVNVLRCHVAGDSVMTLDSTFPQHFQKHCNSIVVPLDPDNVIVYGAPTKKYLTDYCQAYQSEIDAYTKRCVVPVTTKDLYESIIFFSFSFWILFHFFEKYMTDQKC